MPETERGSVGTAFSACGGESRLAPTSQSVVRSVFVYACPGDCDYRAISAPD